MQQDYPGKIIADQARLLYSNALPANITVIAGAMFLLVVLYEAVDHALLYGWAAFMITGALVRLRLYFQWKSRPGLAAPGTWINRYTLATLFIGLTWAAAPVFLLLLPDVFRQGLVLVMLLAMMSVAVPVLSVVMHAFYGYILPAAVLLPVALLQIDHTVAFILAVGCIIYEALVVSTARNTHRLLTQSLQLRMENAGLVSRLNQEVSERKQVQIELEKHQEQLEQHIADKTRALETTNRDLEKEIRERIQAEQEIERLAYYDALTNLPNRRLLLDQLQKIQSRAKRSGQFGALLFLDLDNFKGLNDSLGHAVGDVLLQMVAERLERRLRGDDVVARLGGDEFVTVLSDIGETREKAISHAQSVARQIQRTLSEKYYLEGHEHHTSACIGITLFNDCDDDAGELLKQADAAMYRAKSIGRNGLHFYSPEMQHAMKNRLQTEYDLRTAVERDQFEILYQPQIDAGGNVVGAEALLRWRHPARGFISPADFIPIAEESGIIIQVGEWVIFNACSQIETWIESGIMDTVRHVAVNISPRQFHQENFSRILRSTLDATDTDPSMLTLEVTEGVVLDRVDETIEVMTHLKEIGVGLSVDDFGTGYSSLSYLKRLPLDQLKIDKSFVDDIAIDGNARHIIEAIISMANHMQFNVIAEGVEEESQLRFLQNHGCHVYQGYYFSRPVTAPEFEELVRRSYGVPGALVRSG